MNSVSGTAYQVLAKNTLEEILEHGYGQIVLRVDTIKGQRTKLVIECGKMYVFWFERSSIPEDIL